MVQFIHLLLLLSLCHVAAAYIHERTVWLPEGSNATFPFPPNRPYTYCGTSSKCKCENGKCQSNNSSSSRVTVTDKNLTINNFAQADSGTILCNDGSVNECVYLTLSLGFSDSHHIYFLKDGHKMRRNVGNNFACKNLCTSEKTCKYFTYISGTKICWLMSSPHMNISLHSDAVSGYPSCREPNNSDFTSACDFRQHGLKFYQEAKEWFLAMQHCYKMNSVLVQILDNEVQKAVNDCLRNKAVSGGVWIGLERSIVGINPPWKWISGQNVTESHWNNSAFVDPLNYHCGKIIKVEGSQDLKWLDASCHEKLPFICQGKN
ncbi:lithostathine-1-beta-like [Plectropomus leopardus]|uniref:lithostathine-1-beta-like n=1 Tax=Plectropomus leopardus TaxID=160734 RepID=UPI001C4C5477|nr:lithostathine-1-beta-like [Plectropomus leopardus]XP_042342991.1 lithostathine-1-beta-like [Plectropomus leopardus]